MAFLLYPLAFFLGFPLIIGAWLASVRVYKFTANHLSKQTAFVITLCGVAAVVSLLSAPAWMMGMKAYVLCCAVYVVFVAIGAPHVFRTLRFLGLELDGDPNNDVPLPGDENVTK